mgnify:CR=1 FL=1
MGRRDRGRRALQELPPERAPVDEETQQLLAAMALSKQSLEQERQRLHAFRAQEQQTSQFHAENAPAAELEPPARPNGACQVDAGGPA